MQESLVSILTTTYNHEDFISACVDSILAQTYTNWEMIILDDGSTDRTPEILSQYHDPRIKYFRQANTGKAGEADRCNFCLAQSKGKLIGLLSGDDVSPPDRLEKLVPLFQEQEVVMAFGRHLLIDESGAVISRTRSPKGLTTVLNRPVGSILKQLLVWNFIPGHAALISKRALDQSGGFYNPPGLLAADSPTWFNLALQGEFRYIDRPLGYWRIHTKQQTNNFRMEQATTDAAYTLTFFNSLDKHTQTLTGWTEPKLKKALQNLLNNAYFETGRQHLLSGRRLQAMKYFFVALQKGTSFTKIKALVGLVCVGTRINLELVSRLARRTAWM